MSEEGNLLVDILTQVYKKKSKSYSSEHYQGLHEQKGAIIQS